MKRALQQGFTLIELVVVIVILGILAAIAVPKFSDLAGDARLAVANGTCGALASSAVLLYASNKGSPISTAANIIANTTVQGAVVAGTTCAAITVTPTGGTAVTCPTIASPLCQ